MCRFHGSTTRIELDAQVQGVGDYALIGTNSKVGELYALIWTQVGGKHSWILRNNDSTWKTADYPVDMNRYTYVLDGPNKKMKIRSIVGEEVYSGDTSAETHTQTSQTLALFGRKNVNYDTFSDLVPMKFYGLKMYESDVLTHDFVPAKKGEYGIYDKVTGMFLTRAYGNEFVAGGKPLVFEEDGYLQSTGAEYFDTGFCPKGDTRVEMDFAFVEPVALNGSYGLFGNAGSKTDCLMFMGYCLGGNGSSSGGYAHCCQIGKSEWKTSLVKGTQERRTVVLDGKENKFLVLTQGRTNLVEDLTYNHAGGVSAYTMPIMAYKTASGAVDWLSAVRLYSFKIWDNGTLIHSYVPRIDNSVIYLKDTVVGGTDLYPQGSANNLTVGGAIGGSGTPAYLESDGSQYIQTGYKINPKTKLEMDFALMAGNGDRALTFGVEESVAQVHASLYSMNGKFGFNYGDNSKWLNTTIVSDRKRRQLVWTLAEEKAVLKSGATEEYAFTYAAGAGHSKTAAVGMGIFNAFAPTNGNLNAWRPYPAPMRLYSFKIYEDARLVHHYLPYRNGDVVGLKDVAVPGAPILQDVSGSATPFKVGGLGFGDDLEPFCIQPKGGGIFPGKRRVLSVFAPGAVSYQWYRDGEPIAGATTDELVVDWKQDGADETYAVKAIFDRFGVMAERESAPVTVRHNPLGMSIIVR